MNPRLVYQLNAGTGLVFGALGLAAVAVGFRFPAWPVEFDGTAQEWADFYRAERTSILVSVVLLTLSLVFLLWFFTAVHGVLRAAVGVWGASHGSDRNASGEDLHGTNANEGGGTRAAARGRNSLSYLGRR